MKYLKKFNEEVENIDSVSNTIEDILIPLDDIGCKIEITDSERAPSILRGPENILENITIKITNEEEFNIKSSDCIDSIEHLFRYLHHLHFGYFITVFNNYWDHEYNVHMVKSKMIDREDIFKLPSMVKLVIRIQRMVEI